MPPTLSPESENQNEMTCALLSFLDLCLVRYMLLQCTSPHENVNYYHVCIHLVQLNVNLLYIIHSSLSLSHFHIYWGFEN